MLTMMKKLIKEESGQGLAEYGLILALVAIVVVGALTALSGGLTTILNTVSGKLTTTP